MNMRQARTLVRDYQTADAYLGPKGERPLENNTRIRRLTNGDIAIRLHYTDVVIYHPDGSITLDSGGWLTVTTKDRMNAYLPDRLNVWSNRGRWYLDKYTPDAGEWHRVPGYPQHDYRAGLHEKVGWFFDGIHIAAGGTILNPVTEADAKNLPRAQRHHPYYYAGGYGGAYR